MADVASQGYYWTAEWQRDERIAEQELAAGDVLEFTSTEAAAAWLLAPDGTDE